MTKLVAPSSYMREAFQSAFNELERRDNETLKRRRDVRLENNERLILKDEATGALYKVYITSGVLGIALI